MATTLAGVVAMAQPAAATAVSPPDATQLAQVATRRFEIPPQPLASALRQYSEQSSVQLAYASEELQGLQSPGVQGSHTPEEALRLLLGSNNVVYRFTAANTVTLAKGGDGITLPPVTVEGSVPQENPFGPVSGYVATRNSTGAKTDTPISEVPQSVSVVTRDQMDARGARNVGDALAYSAGLVSGTQGDAGGLGGDSISIRGFGGKGSSGLSDNEYWDGFRMLGTNFAGGQIDSYLFERIEVLRGPASVLYGQNQPGGIVNRVSKRPPATAQGEVQLLGGTFDTRALNVDLGGPLTEDGTFSFRMVGVLSDQDAQMDLTSRQREMVAPSLSWRPTLNTTLTLQSIYQHDDIDGGFLQALPANGTVFDTPNGKIPRNRYVGDPNFSEWSSEAYSIGYFFDHRFDDTWSVRQNARFFHNKQDIKAAYVSSVASDGRTANRATFAAADDGNVFTIDNQAQARFNTGALSHTLLTGLDFQRQEVDDIRRFGTAPSIDLYAPVYFQTIPEPAIFGNSTYLANQVGLYAQDQIKFDGWILTLGGRKDWANSETTDHLAGGLSEDTTDSAFTGRFGLGYAFANGLTPYLSFAQSFEPQSGTDFDGGRFKPTTGEQYETGIKYEPPGYNASITLAAYDLAQQNVPTADPDHPGFSIQTGEVRSRGIELEGVANLDNGWGFIASYSYLDQEVTKSNGDNLGKRPTRMPRNKAALWSSYTFGDDGLDGLEIGAGVRYIGSSMGDSSNTFKVPSYTLFDAAVNYDLSVLNPSLRGVSFGVNATNLTDKTYVAACDWTGGCYYGLGRTVLARLKYEW